MTVNVKAEVTQARIDAMVAAGRAGGATPEATPATQHVDDLNVPDLAASEASDEGQPAETPDPVAALKAEYEQRLAERDEELSNVKAQVASSHRRNQDSARDRQVAEAAALRAEETARKTEMFVRKMEGMGQGLVQLAKLNPEMSGQILQTWANDNGASREREFAIGGGQPSADPRVSELQQELATLKKDISGYAFEVNTGAVAATIDRMLAANAPAFRNAETLGEMDEVRERIWGQFLKAEKENPGAVSPHNPRQVNDAVKKLVDAAVAREKKRDNLTIKNYREDRKALNAQAGAPTRGPSANVRAAPAPIGPAAGESRKQREARWVREFANASKPKVNGTASDI